MLEAGKKTPPPKTSIVEDSKNYAVFYRNRSNALTDIEAEEQRAERKCFD